jgi:hypothetical protein
MRIKGARFPPGSTSGLFVRLGRKREQNTLRILQEHALRATGGTVIRLCNTVI